MIDEEMQIFAFLSTVEVSKYLGCLEPKPTPTQQLATWWQPIAAMGVVTLADWVRQT